MSNFNSAPFLAPLLKNSLRNDEIEVLQYSKDMASAYAILSGEMKLIDNAKSGTTKNQFAIDPVILGGFMGKVKSGLSEIGGVKSVALPLENTKFHQFEDKNQDMLDKQLKTSAGLGSNASRMIYSSDRMSNAELQYAVEAQYGIMKPMYSQFQNFLEFWGNSLTSKYKFKFILNGCSYEFDREKRFDRLMKISDKGLVLNSSAYASVIGMAPQDFDRSLQEGHSGDLANKLSMLFNVNTMKDGFGQGRPREDSSTLTDSGAASRENL